MQGRKQETQKALVKPLFSEVETQRGIPTIEMMLHEQSPLCWGFRGITGDEAKLSHKVEN